MADERLDELITVGDWLRYAVTAFERARLAYGHGTTRAIDEAAFLILSGLELPIDELQPWLPARLLRSERQRLAALIDQRTETRKPAPYLVNRAYIRGRRFYVDERAIVPRSFIGELLCDVIEGEAEMSPFGHAAETISEVLDLCTGGGSLAILAAEAFPDATIDAVDVSTEALEVARRNVADYGLEARIRLVPSDLFAALSGKRYHLILSNPPYVPQARVDAFPPEHQAEPRLAHAGGSDGLDLVRRIMTEAGRHLADDGVLVIEIGLARPEFSASFPGLDPVWLDTAASEGEVFSVTARDLARALAAPSRKPPRKSRG